MAVRSVTIDLTEHPRAGSVQMIVRMTTDNRKEVNRAAKALGVAQADFLRIAILNTARRILADVKGGANE